MRWFFQSALAVILVGMAGCNCVQEGRVVAKHARKGLPRVYANRVFYSFDEPDVYWIQVEGRNQHGRMVHINMLLFRNDWSLIQVGDHWSRCGSSVSKKCGADK